MRKQKHKIHRLEINFGSGFELIASDTDLSYLHGLEKDYRFSYPFVTARIRKGYKGKRSH